MHKVRNVVINRNTYNIIVIRMVALQVQEGDYQLQKQACGMLGAQMYTSQ